ncbi:hypothetical protein FACS189485_22640 [Spirochaetia bacterium]|nr:hypothetical protein FACS189485_22640 [Spirochaetia bacterium]
MKNYKFVTAIIVMGTIIASGISAQTSNSPKVYFDIFWGMNIYVEKMPDDAERTFTGSIDSTQFLSGTLTAKKGMFGDTYDPYAVFIDVGGSFSYLFTQHIGAYIDVAYLNGSYTMTTDLDFVGGLKPDGRPVGNGIDTYEGKLRFGINAFGANVVESDSKVSVHGINFSVGPTFRLVSSNTYHFFLTPKFNFQSYTTNADLTNDFFYFDYGSTSQTREKATHNFTQVDTEFGAGLILDWRWGSKMYFTLKTAVNLDFYQLKTTTQTTSIRRGSELKFETVADSAVTNFSILLLMGIGWAF